jgi:atypical dual specificity phosphatase
LIQRLEDTNIHQVNDIEIEKPDEQSLLDMVRSRQSSYYEGVIEGVYLRRQKDGKTIDRAKIVRSDFIAGDEHWNRRGVIPNAVMEYRW